LILHSDLDLPYQQNIVYKAAKLLKNSYKVKAGTEISLSKNIPVHAGLGGGSSDAASTFIALNELWSLGLSKKELGTIATQIGSDVPFFLNGALALVKGRGEKVTAYKASKATPLLLVKPSIHISTRWAYKNMNSHRLSETDSELTKRRDKSDNNAFLIKTIRNVELSAVRTIRNDLETVTVQHFPVISEIKSRLLQHGAIFSLMSGSGSTVFGVFDSVAAAQDASRFFKDCWTAVVQTLTE
jgi:4-diphosphocytidyl-2-C-methyl-D-erythritol kinase